MKKVLFTLFAVSCFPFLGLAQTTLPFKGGKVVYMFIDRSIKASQQVLYYRSKLWFSNFYREANWVVINDDRETGIVLGKGRTQVVKENGEDQTELNYKFTIDISARKNKYSVRIYDILLISDSSADLPIEKMVEQYQQGKYTTYFKTLFPLINEHFLSIVDTVKKEMNEEPATL